jgi:hypothetical protein
MTSAFPFPGFSWHGAISSRNARSGLVLAGLALALACGGGGGGLLGPGGNGNGGGGGGNGDTISDPGNQGLLNLTLSDAPAEDWATVGVKVLGISLTPAGGGAPVPVYTAAAAAAPTLNLVHLDRLAELLARPAVPAGTYSGAVLTLSAQDGDVTLVAAADPSGDFPEPAGAQVAPARILVQGATGSGAARTVAVPVTFASNLTVTAGAAASLDLELDLAHPAILVPHRTSGETVPGFWVFNPIGRLRGRPGALPGLLLRHRFGKVTSAATDGSQLAVTLALPDGSLSSQSLTLHTDASPLYFTLPAGTQVPFTAPAAAALVGQYVRFAAQTAANGSLSAVRLWSAGTFGQVSTGTEGHVLHVDAGTGTVQVQGDAGAPSSFQVTSATQFFWRAPGSAASAAIASGPGFLTGGNLPRGFKVTAVAGGSGATARTVDVETAGFEGPLAASSPEFTVTGSFSTSGDDYLSTLAFAAGFQWWVFPTPGSTFGSASFLPALGGAVDFGGTVGTLRPRGRVLGAWGDPAAPAGWSAAFAALVPVRLPLGSVTTGWNVAGGNGSFGLSVAGGGRVVTVALDPATAQVYQVNRGAGGVNVSPFQGSLFTALASGSPVRVYGVPVASGMLQGYVVLFYTGTLLPQ